MIVGLVFGVLMLVSVACGTYPNADKSFNPVTPEVNVGGFADYGNGVYYFHKTEANFGNALSAFLGSHPCKIEAIASDGTGGYGSDRGYFVVCR